MRGPPHFLLERDRCAQSQKRGPMKKLEVPARSQCARSCLTAHVCWQSTFSRMQPKPSPTAGCLCATDKCMECPLLIGTGMPSNKVCIHVSASLVVAVCVVIWLLCVCLCGCCVLIIWLLCADCSASALTACGYPVAVRVINGWCVCV